jgi:hypothetical protein
MSEIDKRAVFWTGARRGAKLGLYVATAVAIVVYPIGVLISLSSPKLREQDFGTARRALATIGGAIGGFCLMAFYCALTGAVVLGLISLARKRRRQ